MNFSAEASAAGLSDSDADRGTAEKLVAKALGTTVIDALPAAERELLVAITFAGCCGHKDLNAFKYGVAKLMQGWEERKQQQPVLLANKANSATIRLGSDADSAAVQNAVESSTRGGVKAASLAGAIFNHSDDKKGYQDFHRTFMSINKKEIHGLNDYSRFPDTSNTRYQSHTYAAAELITFLDLYTDLLEHARDAKVKPGFNHMEENLEKALQDPATITELAAITLYGICVSWPYLCVVRGQGTGSVRNLLDQELVDLHRRLPAFCDSIAANPELLLQESVADFSKVTLDGKPWSYSMAVMAIRVLASELPDLKNAISDIFSGCASGWRHFTEEFEPGGSFDSLTPEQRSRIFIPATNDANEGGLGSWRVWLRYHPNSTAASFSNKARLERNNTERFIEKHCNDDDQRHVMRVVRTEGASGENARFKKHLLEAQRKRVRDTRKKLEDAARKKREEIQRLTAVGLELDRTKIANMKVAQLRDQLKIHRLLLSDEVLPHVLQKDIKKKAFLESALLAAVTRNEEYVSVMCIMLLASELLINSPVSIVRSLHFMH